MIKYVVEKEKMEDQSKTSILSKYKKWIIGMGIILFIFWGISIIGGSSSKQIESTKVSAPSPTPSPQPSYPPESIVTPEELKSSPTPKATPKPITKPTTQPQTNTAGGACKYSCSSPDRDCPDFSSHAEAQNFFNCCGFTADNDPMKLDSVGVGDGVACESLP